MRKILGLFILLGVFLPLACAVMTLTSIRPWVLDRGFYEQLVGDKRLYEALLTEDLSIRFDEAMFSANEQLPVEALSNALREVVTPDYLRTQSLHIVDEVFNYLDGSNKPLALSLDIVPIKAALAGAGKMRFASTLAAALPKCPNGEQPIAGDGRLTRCIQTGESVDLAANQIIAALPAALADMPDQIDLENRGYVGANWYDFAWLLGSGIHAVLDMSILMMIFVAVGAGFVGAYLGGNDLHGRLKWLSASLFVPSSLFLFSGLVMTSQWMLGWISSSLATPRWDGVHYSEGFREAVTNVIVPEVQQVGNGVVLTGVIACLIALSLLIWSLVTPAEEQRSPKMVQIPVRNS